MDKKAMYKISYGLFVLTSAFEGRDSGCIINTGIQVTSEPNRIIATFKNDVSRKRQQTNADSPEEKHKQEPHELH